MALKWYIVQTYSGYEAKVKSSLEERIRQQGMGDLIKKIIVPTEKVVEILKGERKTSSRKVFPGYILMQMEFNNETWHLVSHTPRVSGFVGSQEHPAPLSDEEAQKIIQQIEDSAEKPIPKFSYQKGEQVVVIEGPFLNFHGVVDEVKADKGKVRVLVSILGRYTSVEFEFAHIQKAG